MLNFLMSHEDQIVYGDTSHPHLVHFRNQAVGAMTTHSASPIIATDINSLSEKYNVKAVFIDFSSNDGSFVRSNSFLFFLFDFLS